jgi:serine/threonine-protein kinase
MTMATSDLADPEREARLNDILAAYFDALEAGQPDDRATLLARHPDLATELTAFFEEQEHVFGLASPLRSLLRAELFATPPARSESYAEAAGITGLPAFAPRSFDGYELLEQIGEGGMGVVYKARQKSPNRLVALKMLRLSALASTDDLRRFRNEAESVAALDHANIVPLYEVGEHDGQPYFSMKLVEGHCLANQLERFRAEPRAAALLLVELARAVHHAHQRGVLHRDLKPSNILLDAAGQPHITDFGLAKHVEADSSLTQSGALVGTPSYMAPEQASGVRDTVTTATDIYGLGAVLYTLLCGRPPFKGGTVLQTLEQVKRCEPEAPSAGNLQIDRDLENICLKCLEKEPGRRYASAQSLAEDLERWLNGMPTEARPVGRPARFLRWCQRNRLVATLMATVAGVVIFAVVGLGVSTLLIWRAKQLTELEKEQTKAALARAEAQTRWARRAVNEMYTEVAEKWLADEPQMTEMQRHFLLQAMKFYNELTQERSTDPEVRAETGSAYRRLGVIQSALLETDKADQPLRASVAVFEQLFAEGGSDSQLRHELFQSYFELGDFLKSRGQLTEAEIVLKKAADLAAELREASPDDQVCLVQRARSLAVLGDLFRLRSRSSEAELTLKESLDVFHGLVARFPVEADYQKYLARTHITLAEVLFDAGKLEAAEQACRDSATLFEKLNIQFPRTFYYRATGVGASTSLLAGILMERGQFREAEKFVTRSIEVREEVYRDFPELVIDRALCISYANYGRLLFYTGRSQEAEKALRKALDYLHRGIKRDPTHPRWPQVSAGIYGALANLFLAEPAQHREAGQALPFVQKAVELQPDDTTYLTTLGAVQCRIGQWDKALANLERAIALDDSGFGPKQEWRDDGTTLRRAAELNRRVSNVLRWQYLAMCYNHVGAFAKATECYRRAVRTWEAQRQSVALRARELQAIQLEVATFLGVEDSPRDRGDR